MELKDVKLKKGMTKEEVNELIVEFLLLEDDKYINSKYNHNWKCKCGNSFKRSFGYIKNRNSYNCGCVEIDKIEERYKYEVEKSGEYEYIRSYMKGETLPSGKTAKGSPYIQIKHKYCGGIYEVGSGNFINTGQRCGKCCQKYDNSFAYYIEKELNLKIEDIWDFEKNTLNPYHISKFSNVKVWIKCQSEDINESNGLIKKDYHESYEIRCYHFINGTRCSYCASKKVDKYDSFGYWLEKNNLLHLWSDKNTVDPYEISKCNNKKVFMLCDNKEVNETNGLIKKDYHNENGGYEVICNSFINGRRCNYCNSRKVHVYDSFGYHNLDKVQSWHEDNDISPFRVAISSNNKYKFTCDQEGCCNDWMAILYAISRGSWCPSCASSKGEKEVIRILKLNNIEYIPQKEFDNLIGLGNGKLSYDFYLPEFNRLIEYQGDQHKKFVKWIHNSYEAFEKQLEHDRLKREYSISNGYGKVIEIWEDDFSNIESILEKEINHSNPTKSGS